MAAREKAEQASRAAPVALLMDDTPSMSAETAEAFEVDWLGDRRAVGRVEGFARGERLELEVRDWPRIDEPERFTGFIPADELGSAGMHYYLVAVDSKNNETVYPEPAPDEYLKFDLAE